MRWYDYMLCIINIQVTVGQVYSACVDDIQSYGIMLTLQPSGIKTLLHSSKVDHTPGSPMSKNINIGDKIEVKVLGLDKVNQRYIVSRKALLKPVSSKVGLQCVYCDSGYVDEYKKEKLFDNI